MNVGGQKNGEKEGRELQKCVPCQEEEFYSNVKGAKVKGKKTNKQMKKKLKRVKLVEKTGNEARRGVQMKNEAELAAFPLFILLSSALFRLSNTASGTPASAPIPAPSTPAHQRGTRPYTRLLLSRAVGQEQ